MLELHIPQLGEDSRSAKDLIFSELTKEQPLSMIALHRRITKTRNVSITYQGVRKAVELLVEQGALEKTGRVYSISRDWVFSLKSFFDTLAATYDSGKSIHSFTTDLEKENYSIYTLTSLYELDVFWGDMLRYWVDHRGDEEPISVNYGHYTWWMLLNLGRETKLYEYHKKKGIAVYFLWWRDLPLNRWSSRIYNDLGHHSLVQENPEIDEHIAVNVMGDTVVQIKYPLNIVADIKKIFENYSSTQELNMMEITQLAHKACKIQFIVFKNATIAKNLRETYLAHF